MGTHNRAYQGELTRMDDDGFRVEGRDGEVGRVSYLTRGGWWSRGIAPTVRAPRLAAGSVGPRPWQKSSPKIRPRDQIRSEQGDPLRALRERKSHAACPRRADRPCGDRDRLVALIDPRRSRRSQIGGGRVSDAWMTPPGRARRLAWSSLSHRRVQPGAGQSVSVAERRLSTCHRRPFRGHRLPRRLFSVSPR
jgi:hypothetical protein